MAIIVGVRFQNAGKLYYFDPQGTEAAAGDTVIVETARGQEMGEAVTGPTEVPDEDIVPPLRPVIRIATQEDIDHKAQNAEREKSAFSICREKIAEHQLPMKLVSCEYTFDNSKLLFYFTAESRVDFRSLVKDLASIFHVRIELRQIGVRDEARMMGGLGICGRPLCCTRFLGDFHPVSIKMAKEQNLSLNPTKISGACGRLMCCLQYEEDFYEKTSRAMPRVGKLVRTPDGDGVVAEVNILRETVRVRISKGNDMTELKDYPADQVQRVNGIQPPPVSIPADEQDDGPDPEIMHALRASEMDVPDDDADTVLPPDDSDEPNHEDEKSKPVLKHRLAQRTRAPHPAPETDSKPAEDTAPRTENSQTPSQPRQRGGHSHPNRPQKPAQTIQQSAQKSAEAPRTIPDPPKRDPWVVPEEYRQKKHDQE